MDIPHINGTVFFVGIKGVAMANLALILQKIGVRVAGSDSNETFITDKTLQEFGIPVFHSFNADVLPADTALVVYSAAHGGSEGKQVQAAKNQKIQTLHQAELIGELGKLFRKTIAVCGSHGKTTTSAMLAYTLKQLGAEFGWMVGTSEFSGMPAGGFEGDEYFVVEADEYAIDPPRDNSAKFLFIQAQSAIATNIDFDHPDVYEDIEATDSVFRQFFDQVSEQRNGMLFLCADDARLMKIAKLLPDDSFLTFGYAEDAHLRIIEESVSETATSVALEYKGKKLPPVTLSVFGGKHASNAAGVILALMHYGFAYEEICASIKNFTGAKRRFELVSYQNDTYVFDDYAHHPAEIEATIQTARIRFPDRRIVVVFQPHTFSRTKSLQKDFASAFNTADAVILAPVFPSAREKMPENPVGAAELAALAGNKVLAVSDIQQIASVLSGVIQKRDVVFTMGAGDIYKAKDAIIEHINTL